jgi:hypothetical protein
MPDIQNQLTTESLKKDFVSQFDLVNFAIGRAKVLVHRGQHSASAIDYENPANLILEEIYDGECELSLNDLDDVEEPVIIEEVTVEAVEPTKTKSPSKKKR